MTRQDLRRIRGQHRGRQDDSLLRLTTMRYSLRRALSLDSAHNPKVGGSNPPPATKPKLHAISHLNRVERAANQLQLAPISSHSSKVPLRCLLRCPTGAG